MDLKDEGLARRSANIFINYRREDSSGHSGRLFDRLNSRFPGRVFMDVDTIEPGIDFSEIIEQAVGCCEVLLVVIGREWLQITDSAGRRRLESQNDFVRMEVATALKRNIRVIPVLVEDARMPRPEDLPPDMVKLTGRNAIELNDDARWTFDVDRLIQAIDKVLQERAPSSILPVSTVPIQPPPPQKTARPHAWWIPALAFVVLLGLSLAVWTGWRFGRHAIPPAVNTTGASPTPVASPPVPTPTPQGIVVTRPDPPKDKPAQKVKPKDPGDDPNNEGPMSSLAQRAKDLLKNLRDRNQ